MSQPKHISSTGDTAVIYSLEWEPTQKDIEQAVRALKRVRRNKCSAVLQVRHDGRNGFHWGFTDKE